MNSTLQSRIGRVHTTVAAITQRHGYEASTIARHTARIKQLEEEKAELIKAVGVIDRCIQAISANGIGKIEGIVTDGLRRVFGNDQLALVIEKKETARGINYRIQVRKGETVGNPMDSFGGGVQNVVGFLLRLILIKRFKLAPFLALDEQFSNVSPQYQPKVAQLLKTLTAMGFTIFAVSHQPLITSSADNIYELVLNDTGLIPVPFLRKLDGPKREDLYDRPVVEQDQA
jgi:DNA repair exonuclease SbcCD ATPase subunit